MAGEEGQSPAAEGTDVRSAANRIAGLLDDDGHFNPNPDQLSRAHPDYDEDSDERATQQGRDSKGRFTKRDAETEQDASPANDALDDEAVDEDTDDELQAADGDTDEQDVESADDDSVTDQEGTEQDAIQTLEQFAEALEVPLDELLGQVQHSFTAAGENVTVNLSELVSGYQKDADYRKNTTKLAEDRRTAELDYANRMTAFEQEHQALAAQTQYMANYFASQLNSPELDQMRQTDPAEWTAKRSELAEQLQTLNGVRQQAANQYHAFKTQQLMDLKAREVGKLKEKKADFGDVDQSKARQTMQSIGFGDEEIGQIFDHRVVLAAIELADLRAEVEALRNEKQTAKDTAQRVKKTIPKLTQKPGKAVASKKGLNKDNIRNLRSRAKKSGKVEDAAKVIEQLI